jgi:hypothetical protein
MKKLFLALVFCLIGSHAFAQAIPDNRTWTKAVVTCGTTDTPSNAFAGTFMMITLPPSAAAVGIEWGGAAATVANSATYSGAATIVVGAGTFHCIVASGTQQVVVWYK